ncbi:MAG: SUMF1/EgtB/PvdO family nonheme iron enzyme [Planctomycetes bacterium]|nr:SUMF1/EgtB/PvdO family nonheme iron enzyme [Planctomycetota bacterium]
MIRGEQRRGRYATLLAAEDTRLQSDVVIAFPHAPLVADDAAREQCERQLRALARLDHRALVKPLDLGLFAERPFVVRPMLPGGTLADRVAGRDGRLPPPFAVVGWTRDIAAALDFCHARGVVHGDVSPESILFDSGGNACLADLGFAQLERPSLDRAPLEPRDDLRDLAAALYAVLAGVAAEGAAPVALAQRRGDLSEKLTTTVMAALTRDPLHPFASCRDFAEAVREGAFAERRPFAARRASDPPAVGPAVTALARAVAERVVEPPPVAAPVELAAPPPPPPPEPQPAPLPALVVELPAPPSPPAPPLVVASVAPIVAPAALPVATVPPAATVAPRPASWRSTRALFVVAVVLIGAGIAFDAWSATRHSPPAPVGSPPRVAAAKETAPRNAPPTPADPLRRERLRARIAAAPLVPWPLAGSEGYARAREFAAARAAWEQSLGDLSEEVFASVAIESFSAAAARVDAFVAEADALQLALEECSPLFADERRATLCGALTPPRVELLQLRSSAGVAPRPVALRDGRFAVDVELPPEVDRLLLSFERLDGTVLAAFEIRNPPPPARDLPPARGPESTPPAAAAPLASPPEAPREPPAIEPTAVEPPPAAAPSPVDAELAAAGFTPLESPDGRPRWRHEKSGLEFVELAPPAALIDDLPGYRDRRADAGLPRRRSPPDATDRLLVATTECTHAAWRRFAPDALPAEANDALPVVNRSGREIVDFCAAMGLELPYGSEWRWFARGGASDAEAATMGERLAECAWFNANAGGERQPVATLRPNPFGLFDVLGNVWEACLREDESFPALIAQQPAEPVVRPYGGGSCHTAPARCQADQQESFQDGPGASRGFRPIFRLEGSR